VDGVFVGDSLSGNLEDEPEKQEIYDPWISLAAIAVATRRVRIGTMVTPLARRRPWKVARETVTLDHLCQGRLILPVGLGAAGDWGFTKVREELDRKIRAEWLDEGLAILAGLWSGQAFSYVGSHYQVQEMTFVPPPVQQTRIPIWVVGAWPRPKSLRRALQWDGILPTNPSSYQQEGSFTEMTPADIQELRTYIAQHRPQETPFDIVIEGEIPGDDPVAATNQLQPFAQAGVTWWIEAVWATPETEGGEISWVGFSPSYLGGGRPGQFWCCLLSRLCFWEKLPQGYGASLCQLCCNKQEATSKTTDLSYSCLRSGLRLAM
jgi:hypothetical protein